MHCVDFSRTPRRAAGPPRRAEQRPRIPPSTQPFRTSGGTLTTSVCGPPPMPCSKDGECFQALPSLLFAVFGGILTGLLLQHIQDWLTFLRVPELFILLPVPINLKGNLKMDFAARLSTRTNVGDLDSPKGRWALVVGNMTRLQVEALIVSFLASLLSFTMGLLSRNNLPSLRIAHAKPLVVVKPKLPS
ncbi:hypothetical protein PCASD_17043 [Puccinia coronata f. sp. avenae]|uniref:Uncharacterized protein n=1 Tax=Puccinia coronata f. sp. avenae TaxID=200324 RepID=A0A2N5U1K8_9BASI|nr:hypothetical protein PCASD_17043 [Puccinia coronata f. sp. avenae]